MRTTLVRSALMLLIALSVVACTRERPSTEGATIQDATAGAIVSTPSSGEPQVEVTSAAATPEPTVTEESTPTPEAETERETINYTVQVGDTIGSIADRFGASIQEIRERNFLLDDNIFAGQVLLVPVVPTPTPAPFVYVVQPGDSLSSIAFQFGLSALTLVEVNNIQDQNNIAVGTELLIPGRQAPVAETTAGDAGSEEEVTVVDGGEVQPQPASVAGSQVVHIVQPGETFFSIAEDYGVDPAVLAEANGITNRNVIRAGQQLVIPGITERQALEARGSTHVVKSGESLSTIAEAYGVTMDAIMALNGIDDPDRIVVGQELLIPPAE